MKQLILFVLTLFIFIGCQKKTTVPVTASKAQIDFEIEEHNFGDSVVHHEPTSFNFVFHNTGATPLIIQKVEASCSCTEATFDKKPVAPGEQGVIHVTYKANNGTGHFSHYVAVYSNGADSTGYTSLHIEGAVIERH